MKNNKKASVAGFISLVLSLQPTAGLAVMASSMEAPTASSTTIELAQRRGGGGGGSRGGGSRSSGCLLYTSDAADE